MSRNRLLKPVLVVSLIAAVAFGGWAYFDHQAATELAALQSEVDADNARLAGMESEIRALFPSWERNTTERGATIVWRGDKAKVLWVQFRKATVSSLYHLKRPADWQVVAQTPSGRLFYVVFNPETKTFVDFQEVDRDWVFREAAGIGRRLNESDLIRRDGPEA